MLLRSWVPVVLALVRLIKADNNDGFSSLSSCGQNCINNMRTSTGCVPVTDECLCSSQNFIYGITDCANSACTSSEAQSALDWAESWCASVTASTSTAATTSTAEATSTSEAAATTDAATTSVAAAVTTSDSSTPAAEAAQTTASDTATTTPAAAATSVTDTASTDATATTSATSDASSAEGTGTATQGTSDGSATGGASSASTSTSASGSSSSSSSSDETTSSGLSSGAKAGIVVGAAGAAIMVVAAVLYLSRKRKKPLPRGTMKISEPLPGSGRIGDDVWERYHSPPPFSPMYSSKQQPIPPGTAGSNYSELSRHARPYEDMVPRMTPTRMV